MTTERCVFDIVVPAPPLECGAPVPTSIYVRGWSEGPAGTVDGLAARGASIVQTGEAIPARETIVTRPTEPTPSRNGATAPPNPDGDDVPTILVVHALTGDMRVGGPGGWWERVVGPGRALDTRRFRVLCLNNLGSCYGTWGPADPGFPTRAQVPRSGPLPTPSKGAFDDDPRLPAPITTWDQAALLIAALDALGVRTVELATGGSIGAMIVLCLGVLAPDRFARIAPIAGCAAASPWVIAWNHVGRQTLLLDAGFPDAGDRGLELARQLAHTTYRAEPGLDDRHGRATAAGAGAPDGHYSAQTYLEHQGRKLRARFHAGAYAAQLDAMDHHDVERVPRWLRPQPETWGLDAVAATTLYVVIDSDQLFFPEHGVRIAARVAARGATAETFTIESLHGHDAFLIETDQVERALRRALSLSPT